MAVSFKDFNTMETKSYSNKYLMDSAESVGESKIPRWRLKWMLRLTNIYYNASLDMLNLLTTMYLVVFDVHMRNTYILDETAFIISLIIQSIFFFDMLVNFIIIGPKKLCGGRKKIYYELMLQVGFIFVLITDYSLKYQKLGENNVT